ncbi:MAG: hypothetical protein M1812_002669 [Candelaria pacifica]|nr:MAG: hypothetical protein M1812_002669 [Candelaria pacifica]
MPTNFTPLLPSLSTYRSNSLRAPAFGHNFLRGNFTITTWLLLGALFQILLFLLPLRLTYTAAPVLVLLSWQILDHLLMIIGLKPDIYQKRALKAKYTALFPDENGEFTKGDKKGIAPGAGNICVFILGFSVNHVLGPLAPGSAKLSEYAQAMFKELETQASEYGLLSFNYYTNSGAHTTGCEIMTIYYFKDMDYVHKFANSSVHRKGWDWFNRHTKEYPHLGIMHELYQVPKNKWENVYINYEPTLFGTAQHHITNKDGTEKWISGIVDAKGRLKASHVRLGLDSLYSLEEDITTGDDNIEE